MGWEGTSVAVAALMMPFTGGLGGQIRLVGGRVAERSLGQPLGCDRRNYSRGSEAFWRGRRA